MRGSPTVRHLLVCFAVASCIWIARPLVAQSSSPGAVDSTCGRVLRRPDWAQICGRVVDKKAGMGVPGGWTRFRRPDGAWSFGDIAVDGRFTFNIPSGQGTFGLAWGCRSRERYTESLTVAAGQGITRLIEVDMDALDTLCRVRVARADTSAAAVARWLARGPCFAFTYGTWNQGDASGWPTGATVQLDSIPDDPNEPTTLRQFRDRGPMYEDWPSRSWQPIRGDSVEIGWSTGFGGLNVTVRLFGDSLTGVAQYWDDLIRRDSLGFRDRSMYPRASVSGRRVPCALPILRRSEGVGFLVIGPDTQTMRSWTAQWMREVIERDAPRHLERLFGHDSVVLSLLDTEDAPPSNPPPGPSAEAQSRESYPHDLRIAVSLPDLQRMTKVLRVQSFAQVIIEPLPRGFRLTAQVLHAADPRVPVHLTVTAPTLRDAAVRMAQELIAEWDSARDAPRP